ncbi:hypothetical protein ACSDIA_003304 [Cronobacter turicensis]|uniref:hypothetical protein n=1 Tax=Cronobacter turicensis TaxID=413502 RepID=UPI0015881045|nr:hypothetical protein [Cronobacter turicensis]ELY5929568.1 hypothetical protein [Cronobacter turicensis]NUW57023.1 hypothetical protein [Cronobacter turicensis]
MLTIDHQAKKKPAPGWLRNTGSNVSNVVLSGCSVGVPPERMTIIIIIIRMCPDFFEKNLGIDRQEKTIDVERDFLFLGG